MAIRVGPASILRWRFLFMYVLPSFLVILVLMKYSNWGIPPQPLFYIPPPPSSSISNHSDSGPPPIPENGSRHCFPIAPFIPEIDVSLKYSTLEFDSQTWNGINYWNPQYEKRYQDLGNRDHDPPPLKVIVVPHSHNDPGWHQTFENYFSRITTKILDNAVEKLEEYPDFRFIWSEISFLEKWWSQADDSQRQTFKKHVQEGRLEIVTGGWVMTDEATVSLYSMIDQLVEGHQWVKAHLNVTPTTSWSVDPFGHGSTFPYLLKASSINGMVIQRIHHGWKKWFADQQKGDFEWVQRWDDTKMYGIRCHNAPWDMYTLKFACGPTPQICESKFDFVHDGYGIHKNELKRMSEMLLEQYGKTASLYSHNVALIALGDDFRYDKTTEWDRQYRNFKAMFDHINSQKEVYNNAEILFGTVSDYFRAVEERKYKWPTLSGDFHVYSDKYVWQQPAYWSGYYSTRPFWKKFYRETEAKVRDAEILFTLANNKGQSEGKILKEVYAKLVVARRWLALFSHHDATTGTSKQHVMNDYGVKLLEAWRAAGQVQETALNVMLFGNAKAEDTGLRQDVELKDFGDLPETAILEFADIKDVKQLVFWNSLARERTHLAKFVVTSPLVEVLGPDGHPVTTQINPRLEKHDTTSITINDKSFEVAFLARLPPLSVAIYQVRRTKTPGATTKRSTIHCSTCTITGEIFPVKSPDPNALELQNSQIKLHFDGDSGLLKEVQRTGAEPMKVALGFGSYESFRGTSGAYLLHPDTSRTHEVPFRSDVRKVIIVEGPLYSEMTVIHAPIILSTSLMHDGDQDMQSAIWMQNRVDLGNHEGEIFMRLSTTLESVTTTNLPSWWSDQAGYTFEKRVKVPTIRYEGNTYPVNTMAYLQDEEWRLSLLVDRSHGCSSMEMGLLECMIERRTPYDDGRGLGEGVTDNRPTISNYVLFLEQLSAAAHQSEYQHSLPTLMAHQLSLELSYPAAMFVKHKNSSEQTSNGSQPGIIPLLNQELPCDVHLVNLRTLTDYNGLNHPSSKALLILQRFGHTCSAVYGNSKWRNCTGGKYLFKSNTQFNGASMNIVRTDLTGVSGERSLMYKHADGNRKSIRLEHLMSKPFELSSLILEFEQ